MTSPLIVRIIFSGLIMLASEGKWPDDQVALLVNADSHNSVILLAEGTCKSDGISIFDHECIEGDLWPFFSELWILGEGSQYDLSLSGGGLLFDKQHRETGRPQGIPLPAAVGHLADASWLPSMHWALGSELDSDCLAPDLTKACPDVRARFRLPTVKPGAGNRSGVGACHLLHRVDLSILKGVADACRPMEEGEDSGGEQIQLVELKPAAGMPETRAMANGFMLEVVIAGHPIGEPLELMLKESESGESDRIQLRPKQLAGQQILTILVFNEPPHSAGGDPAAPLARLVPKSGEWLGHFSSEREHFDEYCKLFGRVPGECKNPEVKGDGTFFQVGTCERYFDCLDAILLNRLFKRASDKAPAAAGMPAVRSAVDFLMFPHSSGACDTSGYP